MTFRDDEQRKIFLSYYNRKAKTDYQGQECSFSEEDFEYIPAVDEFVAVEIPPEMIHQVAPVYPHWVQEAGMEGRVWVKALVCKDGTVRDAVVAKSSGFPSLDKAALQAAKYNRFKPGIQNGKPINLWVTYKVDFVLEQSIS